MPLGKVKNVMVVESLINRPSSLFYGGRWHEAGGTEILRPVNPANGETIAELRCANEHDVQAAVHEAEMAYPAWRELGGRVRGQYLMGFANALKTRTEWLVELQMTNNGKPRQEAAIDVADAIATFEYYADSAIALDERQWEPVSLPDSSVTARTRFEPVGPVGMIVPWNFPLVTSAWKIAPALAAGCTLVLKTSEMTPLIELVYADIAIDVQLPPGVLNLVTGAVDAGVALCRDTRLRKVSFTGSNQVGSKVMEAVSPRCLPISLELGGKSPIVVFEDAPTDLAVDCIMAGIFFNCGQMCSASSRLIIHEACAPAILDELVKRTRQLVVGDPFADGVEMGPITTKSQFEKVCSTLELARKDQLTCLAGGNALDRPGFFIEPTLYHNVPTDHPIWREEIFGPVLAINTFKTEVQAVSMANDSDYGLVATIISADSERADRVASLVDGGHVWINSPQIIYPHTAWGGFKSSGIGRELGPWGLSAYLGVKNITTSVDVRSE